MKTAASSVSFFRLALFLCSACAAFLFAQWAYASETDGTINGTNKWAWSESAGWIDFGTSEGGVHVTDSALSGYAYGETLGWISLNCSNTSSCGDNSYKVSNTASGTLSGYAWGANTGWIDFAPSGGGVRINSSGVFSGTAYAENIGWIVFGTDHPVTTDWRPSSARSSTSGGGGGGPISGPMGYGYIGNGSSPATIPVVVPTATTTTSTTVRTTAAPKYNFTKNRRVGETGDDIKLLQQFLNNHGSPVATEGAGSPGQETTYFGPRTRAAVAAFQKTQGIEPPAGYFGPLTRAYINSHY